MYPSGSGNVVSTGISNGTVKKHAKDNTGATRKNGPTPAGRSASLPNNLPRS